MSILMTFLCFLSPEGAVTNMMLKAWCGVVWCGGVSSRIGIGQDRTRQDRKGLDRID